MPYTTPKFLITVPSPTTRLNRLGAELQQLGASLEAALSKFNYNGKDPNLVLSRVAALEAREENRQRGRSSYASGVDGNASGIAWGPIRSVTFPKPFAAGTTPNVYVSQVSGDHVGFSYVASVTNTGFTYRIVRVGSTVSSGTLSWLAEIA